MKSSKKIHWVGWQKVTKPKEEGGLGLQTAKGRNTALLAKLNWRFNVEKEALWARVLRQNIAARGESIQPMRTNYNVCRFGKQSRKGGVSSMRVACGRLEGIVISGFGGIIGRVKGLSIV